MISIFQGVTSTLCKLPLFKARIVQTIKHGIIEDAKQIDKCLIILMNAKVRNVQID